MFSLYKDLRPQPLPAPGADHSARKKRVALYFMTMHILFEDGLQLAMYTVVSTSSTTVGRRRLDQALDSIPVYMGILQGIFFFLYKTQELFKVVDDRLSS